ncbi:hypothetical protein KAR91_70100 [Candidatus Pacearchaeota archaeon]|nr:hypothetical protein [Candidatus Pacearchaeota archaeon]
MYNSQSIRSELHYVVQDYKTQGLEAPPAKAWDGFMRLGYNGSGYYWVDKRGHLHYKPTLIVDAVGAEKYFNSPNVLKYWHIKSMEEYKKIVMVVNKAKTVDAK